jgi:hypothetical protein
MEGSQIGQCINNYYKELFFSLFFTFLLPLGEAGWGLFVFLSLFPFPPSFGGAGGGFCGE